MSFPPGSDAGQRMAEGAHPDHSCRKRIVTTLRRLLLSTSPVGELAIRQFGTFRLDPAERLLLRDGHPVALTPKAFDLLLYLVDRPGRLVEKQTVMAALWPDAMVEEGNLASTVSALRKALGDDGDEQRAIATVPTRGYRFVMPVARLAAPQSKNATGQKSNTPARNAYDIARRATGLALWSGVMVAAGWMLAGRGARPPTPVMSVRIGIEPADGIRGPDLHGEEWGWGNRPSRTAIAFSPDGRQLVFAGLRGDRQELWLRSLDRGQATPIQGAEQAAAPFFSPDGGWIAFWSRGALWKVPVAGGVPTKICAARLSFGASWGTDDSIVFADEFDGGLRRVAAKGGVPQTLTTVNVAKGEGSHRFPHVLPGARAVVFTILVTPNEPRLGMSVALQSLDTGERRILFRDAADARYVPTGHLVYVAGGTLMAAPFDLRTLQVTGDSVGLLEGKVMQSDTTTASQFAVSDSGSLAWLPAIAHSHAEDFRTIVWVDRYGKSTPVGAADDAYYQPRLSPDGLEIAVQTVQSRAAIWIHDIRRGVRRRVPFDGFASSPLWTPDGKRLVFRGAREGNTNLYWIPKDGGSPAERLTTNALTQFPASWTPDGRVLVFLQCTFQCDIWALSVDGHDRKVWPVIQTPVHETYPQLSPDGAWLAYVSDQSGHNEVWVQPFPGPGEPHQVSTEGGTLPRWSTDGRSLYYCARPTDSPQPMSLPLPSRTGNTYLVVDISTSPAFRVSAPHIVFQDPEMKYTGVPALTGYDVAPDGRFLMVEVKRGPGVIPPPPSDVRLIVNWSEELRARVSGR
jgi:eukaryotic-like serine/threonine-protein kinase